jgi:hypothetical protein
MLGTGMLKNVQRLQQMSFYTEGGLQGCNAMCFVCGYQYFGVMLSPHVKWVHCHHGMARPRVVDRGDGLQIWRIAANILNKQSQTADSGWSSSLRVGRGPNNPSP